jgi:diguanylate cyclase (GGDEF)-like protein
VFITVLWLVAISTSALSAMNERELRRRRGDLEALTDLAESLERAVDSSNIARSLLDSVIDTFGFPRGVVLAGPEGQLPVLASYGLEESTARRPAARVAAPSSTRRTARTPRCSCAAWTPSPTRGWPRCCPTPRTWSWSRCRPRAARSARWCSSSPTCPAAASSAASCPVSSAPPPTPRSPCATPGCSSRSSGSAATDGLTKIANRRTFEATLEREVARATRSAEHVSLVMVDIDHFKSLNDTHGHQAGDEVLRNVAAALAIECRDFDTPARYGGEEFAIVLPGCGPDEALKIAERLRHAVSAAPSIVPITASAGVATFPATPATPTPWSALRTTRCTRASGRPQPHHRLAGRPARGAGRRAAAARGLPAARPRPRRRGQRQGGREDPRARAAARASSG